LESVIGDDPIVAWFDEFCRDQFESGVTSRAPIAIRFRPNDTRCFPGIMNAIPTMMRTVVYLSEWVRFAEELENACEYANRG
jgi:hypothetical protein